MTFPTTSLLDDFNRSNQTPLGGIWVRAWGSHDWKIDTNRAMPADTSQYNTAYISGATYGPDTEVYFAVHQYPISGMNMDLYIRAVNPTNSSTLTCYLFQLLNGNLIKVFRCDTGYIWTQLGGNYTISSPAVDDLVGFTVISDDLQIWWKAGAAAWALQGTETDATFTTAGYIGIESYYETLAQAPIIDDFSGGAVVVSGGGSPLDARWLNFWARGQTWFHFWQDAAIPGGDVSVLETASAADAETAALITAAARIEAASAADTPTASNITAAARVEAASALDTPDASRAYAAAQVETATAADTPSALQARAAAQTEAAGAVEASDRTLVAVAARVEAASAADAPAGTKVGIAAIAEPAAATETPGAIREATASRVEGAAASDSPVAALITSAAVVEAAQASDQQSTGAMPKDASIVEAANAIDAANAELGGVVPPTPSPSRQQAVQIYEDPGSYARLMEENKRRALELWVELFRGVLHLSEEDARLRAVAQLDFEQQQIEEEELVLML